MMSNAFADRKLQPGFTARVVELIKETKIQTPPHKTALPLGLSAVGGVIIVLLSLSIPHTPLYPLGEWIGSPLPLKTEVVENGEMAVDAEVTKVALLADIQGDGDFGQTPKPLQTPAAIAEGEETDEKQVTVTGIHLPDDLDISWNIDISPDGTKMVYSTRTNSGHQLTVRPLVDASTDVSSERTVLLQEMTASYINPKWSPDGKWIAFYRHEHSLRPENPDIINVYLIPAVGGKMRLLAKTNFQEYLAGLSWSPDNKELAFVRQKGEAFDIYIVSIDTGVVRPFTTDGKENVWPSWSPDGKWIFYSSRRGILFGDSWRVWSQPVDGGKAIVNKRLGNRLIHSPDGKWIVYTGRLPDGESGFVAARVNEQGELTGEPILLKEAIVHVGAEPLRWTPDGQLIVLQEDYREMTYALNIKNGEQRRVSSDPAFAFEYAQWLSDGKRLFVVSAKDLRPGFFDIETTQFMELPIERPEGSRFGQSTLSPDEKWVAFVQIHPKTPQEAFPEQFEVSAYLYIMSVNGGTPKPVVSRTESFIHNPRWSPDGQKIAFLNMKIITPEGPRSQLCVVSVPDGQVTTLTDSELCMELAWSPDATILAYLQLKAKGKIFNPDEMDGDLYIVSATGGESKQITNTPEKEQKISWTPDGKRLIFEIYGETWVVSIDGGTAQKLQRGYIPSSWALDGLSYLAFGHRGELQRVSLDGATSPILTSGRWVQVPTNARPLSMAPDGETILFRQIDSGTLCWKIDVSHLVDQ